MTKSNNADGRWLRIADLLLAVTAGGLWYATAGGLGWWLLFLPLTPWAIRVASDKPPFRRTPFDWLILVFLLTAVVGVWAAYDQDAALGKFWILVGAIFIYYAMAGQRRSELWRAFGIVSGVGALIAGYFLLTHDWQVWPTDIDLLTQIGRRWMAVRPNLPLPSLHPNILGGQMAVVLPASIAFVAYCWRRREWLWTGIAGVLVAITASGLLLTSSRAAWAALVVAMGLWFLWILSASIAKLVSFSRSTTYLLMLLLLGAAGSWLLFTFTDGPAVILAKLPGPDSSTSRLDVMQQAWRLAGDFPYTGGGLSAFAGLFSNYIRVIPHFFFSYSHNFLLDVMLEQGIAGALAMLAILMGSGWLLVFPGKSRRRRSSSSDSGRQLFRWAMVASLVTLLLHGLVDDALYANLASPLLLMVPGMAVALSSKRVQQAGQKRPSRRLSRAIVTVAAAVGIFAGLFFGFRRPLLSAWYANLGAVEMARVELVGWPTGGWDNGRNVALLAPSADLFREALRWNPDSRTAQYRLGLIAMLQRDYQAAVAYLKPAHQLDPGHRGISKSLGYSYTWSGEWESALVLLADIPETRDEMDVYTWWWGTQSRPDLATQAELLLDQYTYEADVDSDSR